MQLNHETKLTTALRKLHPVQLCVVFFVHLVCLILIFNTLAPFFIATNFCAILVFEVTQKA